MELKDIASISGKGGLFKIVKPGKTGVILESLDAAKVKLAVNGTQKMSLLSEISIFVSLRICTSNILMTEGRIFPEMDAIKNSIQLIIAINKFFVAKVKISIFHRLSFGH